MKGIYWLVIFLGNYICSVGRENTLMTNSICVLFHVDSLLNVEISMVPQLNVGGVCGWTGALMFNVHSM